MEIFVNPTPSTPTGSVQGVEVFFGELPSKSGWQPVLENIGSTDLPILLKPGAGIYARRVDPEAK